MYTVISLFRILHVAVQAVFQSQSLCGFFQNALPLIVDVEFVVVLADTINSPPRSCAKKSDRCCLSKTTFDFPNKDDGLTHVADSRGV